MGTIAVVRAVNELTGRWAETATADGNGTVFAPVGVWPLLGLLACGADEPAVTELEAALGMRADAAAEGARHLLDFLSRQPGLSAALGLWTADSIKLEPTWASALPRHARGTLTGDEGTDRALLDSWVERCTEGLVKTAPVHLDEDTRLVLASALVARTHWIQPFTDSAHTPVDGPWAGRDLAALTRRTSLLDRAAVLHTPAGSVTELRALGKGSLDVHLLLGGEHTPPAETLKAGIAALAGQGDRITADALPAHDAGPGMDISWVRSYEDAPQLDVITVPFALTSKHDLLKHSDLFGLTTVADSDHGHFSGISHSEPLAVQSARQSATAVFSATGFETAAVTAIGMAEAGAAWNPPPLRVKRVQVCFDRPFGFLAVQRCTRLILAAGWVAQADDNPDV